MKRLISKSSAQEEVDKFFKKKKFKSEQVRKIKRIAMKYKIKLGVYRNNFCKKCFSKLRGKTSITKHHKTIICASCSHKNKFRL